VKSVCNKCLPISSLLRGKDNLVSRDNWELLKHESLIDFMSTNNGVSEGTEVYICKDCYFIIEAYFHIGFEGNQLNLSQVESITEEELEAIAIAFLMDNRVDQLKDSILEKEKIRVYRYTNIWKPAVFNFRTPEEVRMYSLEIVQNFGINHNKYSDFSYLYLSLDELITDKGSNNEYYEKTFIISFEVSPMDLIIEANSSEYSPSEVRISTSKQILPQQILYYDLEKNTYSPLINVSINDLINRDNTTYLKLLIEKAEQLKVDHVKMEMIIEDKMREIRSFFTIVN
jgi:hypothetical protein